MDYAAWWSRLQAAERKMNHANDEDARIRAQDELDTCEMFMATHGIDRATLEKLAQGRRG